MSIHECPFSTPNQLIRACCALPRTFGREPTPLRTLGNDVPKAGLRLSSGYWALPQLRSGVLVSKQALSATYGQPIGIPGGTAGSNWRSAMVVAKASRSASSTPNPRRQ